MNTDSALDLVIRDFSSGIYTTRMRIDDPDSSARGTAEKMNRLLDIIEGAIKTQNRDISAEKKMNQYYSGLIRNVMRDLSSLSAGDTGFIPGKPEHDPAVPDVYQQACTISASVQDIRNMIHTLSADLSRLNHDTAAGKTGIQIDDSLYKGDFHAIASGINQVLDSARLPLTESVRVAQEFARYDFEARFDPAVPLPGEWTVLKQAFDSIGLQIHDAFGSINTQVMELSANTEEANASVQEVANTSEQVARNSDAVSQNMEQSDAGVRQVLRAMEDLSVTVGDVSQKAESVARIVQESTALSREGTEFARKAEEGMTVITRSAGDMDRLIGAIQQEMKKINEIVRLITEIANQTNLLALNAAIEAARAGDLGRGFAVVASEVKALALESRGSAEKITDMISNLQKQSQKAADAVSVATTAVQDGNVMLSDTLRVFGRLAGAVEDISTNIEQVASMNEEQAAAVEEITSSMHEVAAMLKDTAKEAIDSAHATGETSASVNQLRVIVDQVAGISEQISVSMSRFRF